MNIRKQHVSRAAILFIVLSLIVSVAKSQENRTKNSIFFEGYGNGILYSINYDRLITNSFGARIGYSKFDLGNEFSFTTIPVLLNYFVGEQNSRLELGAGIVHVSVSGNFTWFADTFKADKAFFTSVIGYRFQPIDGGLLFRIDFTPIIGNGKFLPFGGISLGATF
jgi:hypothetical protein